MNDKAQAALRNRHLGFVFQSFRLIHSLSVLDNVELPLLYRRMGAEVMDILHKLNREDGRTIVMVTHNEQQARQTNRTIRFFDGRQIQ
jgi:ABC-type lipoprotein export system ATPase subunit